ncbi:MAG: hypothetical protein ACXVH3_32035 [Solirubrobacteraceae bacterium]
MSTAIRVYLGWRLLRMLRPLLCATMIIAAVFALNINHATPNRSAAAAIKGGAAAARLDLPRALQRAFQPAHHRP